MFDNKDCGIADLLNEISDTSPNDGFFTSGQLEKGVQALRREVGVLDTDSPEEAAAKIRAEVAEQFGDDARYEWHPSVVAEAKRRQDTYKELSTAIRRGQMSRDTAAVEWERRHGTPKSLARVKSEERERLLNARPPSRTLQDIEAERRVWDEEAQKALGGDPSYGALRSIEWMLKEIKGGR